MGNIVVQSKRIKIPFHIHPYKFEEGLHAVEKSDTQGRKRRYLVGITSGMKTDGHGERMTKSCVDNMQEQAKSGIIRLYVGQHNVDHVEDIGKLVDSNVNQLGEWITSYRLYDDFDGLEKGSNKLQRADTLWRQVNGLPPYVDDETGQPRPLQFGFSIEGYIPDGGIVEMSETGQRTIQRVDLDGVLVTPRPSYKDSALTAVYKALDELDPSKRITVSENIRGKFINRIEDERRRESYYSKRFKLDEALDESIDEIMTRGMQVHDRLQLLFSEYSTMMIQLIMEHRGVFVRPKDQPDVPDDTGAVNVAKKLRRVQVLKNIEDQMSGLVGSYTKRATKSKSKEIVHGRNSTKRTKPRRKAHH